MLVECDVWVSDPSQIIHTPKGFGYCKMWIERKVVDTDLLDWFERVVAVKAAYEYPYPDQFDVPYKERGRRPIVVPRRTLEKIRELLGKNIIKI